MCNGTLATLSQLFAEPDGLARQSDIAELRDEINSVATALDKAITILAQYPGQPHTAADQLGKLAGVR